MMVNGRKLTPEQIADLPEDLPLRQVAAGHPPLHRPGLNQEFRFEVKRASSQRPVLVMHHEGAGPTLIPLPDSRIDRTLDGFRQQLGWGLGLILLLGTALAALLARRIAAPLARLSQAAERVGHGELGVQTAPAGPPEVRRSIEAFNTMSTELAQMQAERDRLRADRELAELGEIGRGLAHSLRNPLHALGLSLDLLAEGNAPARATQLAEAGRDQLQRIDQTLRGFLALSASAGAQVERVALADLLDDVILEARQRAQGRVRIERGDCDLHLPAVAAELRIVVHALVINAVEACGEGGEVRMDVAAHQDGGVLLRIADDGQGIPAELRDRLFQPHVSSKPTGAGMGLYLAERLVRLRYRGSITLRSNAPNGTVAEVRLWPREAEHVG
jgi:signal transduction histidine kinase